MRKGLWIPDQVGNDIGGENDIEKEPIDIENELIDIEKEPNDIENEQTAMEKEPIDIDKKRVEYSYSPIIAVGTDRGCQ